MLDTSIVPELARNPHGFVSSHISELGSGAIRVSIITAAELRFDCARKGCPALSAQIEVILGSMQVLSLKQFLKAVTAGSGLAR